MWSESSGLEGASSIGGNQPKAFGWQHPKKTTCTNENIWKLDELVETGRQQWLYVCNSMIVSPVHYWWFRLILTISPWPRSRWRDGSRPRRGAMPQDESNSSNGVHVVNLDGCTKQSQSLYDQECLVRELEETFWVDKSKSLYITDDKYR